MSNYNNNELRKHKASDMIKWVIVFVLILALLASVVMIGLKVYGVLDKKDEAPAEDEAAKGDNVVSEIEEQDRESDLETGAHISLKSSYATSPTGTDKTTMTLTATVEPATADQTVDWSIAFKNPSSTWATGKNIADYMTVTPSEDGSKTATVKVLKAYGEQIVVTVASREDNTKKASCTYDYVKQIKFSLASSGSLSTSALTASYAEYGDGTISDLSGKATYYIDARNFAKAWGQESSSNATTSVEFTGNSMILAGGAAEQDCPLKAMSISGGSIVPFNFESAALGDDGEGKVAILFSKGKINNRMFLSFLMSPFIGKMLGFTSSISGNYASANEYINTFNTLTNYKNYTTSDFALCLDYQGQYLDVQADIKVYFPEIGSIPTFVTGVSASQSSYVFGGNK